MDGATVLFRAPAPRAVRHLLSEQVARCSGSELNNRIFRSIREVSIAESIFRPKSGARTPRRAALLRGSHCSGLRKYSVIIGVKSVVGVKSIAGISRSKVVVKGEELLVE